MSKSKYAYYAAYSKNRASIYTNWDEFDRHMKFYKGLKYKGFYFVDEALEYIVDGICNDYKILKPDQIDVSVLRKNKNYDFGIDKLKKK